MGNTYFLLLITLTGILAYAIRCAIIKPYKFRLAIIFTGISLFVLCWLPFMLFRPRDYRNALAPAWFFRCLSRMIGVTFEVRGINNVRRDRGGVVLMNHQSILDLNILAYLWPVIGRPTVVSRKEVIYVPFFGIGAWLWGTLFINRSNRHASIASLNKQSQAINEKNAKILIFPEGTRHDGETLLPFKKGPFHMAMSSKCRIQPVVVSRYNFTDDKQKTFQPGHAIIHILPEIDTQNYADVNELIEDCRNTMVKEFARLSEEARDINARNESLKLNN